MTAAVPVEVRQQQLADGIYQFTVAEDGYVENLNSLVVITDRDVLVFDTTTRPSTARDILAGIRKLTDRPIRFVVNSHWHPDHWSGNEVFAAANPGVDIIATEQMRDFMFNLSAIWPATMPANFAAREKALRALLDSGVDAAGKPISAIDRRDTERSLDLHRTLVDELVAVKRTYPTITYDDRLILHHGGREIHLISVTGDAAGTTVLYLPREGILATGDAVSWPLPYYTPPIREHAASLRDLASLGAKIIVPGHGPTMRDHSYLTLEADLFEEVVRQVRAALRGGAVKLEDVQKKVDLAALKPRFVALDPEVDGVWDTWTDGLVRNAYVDLRDSKIPPTPPAR